MQSGTLFARCTAALLFALVFAAQAAVKLDEKQTQPFAREEMDWGVEPIKEPKRPPVHAPTPTSIPGGRVIRTLQLKELLAKRKDVVIVDVLDSGNRFSVPGASWMMGAGLPIFLPADVAKYEKTLGELTGRRKDRPLVFLCQGPECWLSYNAALRAIDLGYKDVLWYRGGTDAWRAANLELAQAKRIDWMRGPMPPLPSR